MLIHLFGLPYFDSSLCAIEFDFHHLIMSICDPNSILTDHMDMRITKNDHCMITYVIIWIMPIYVCLYEFDYVDYMIMGYAYDSMITCM